MTKSTLPIRREARSERAARVGVALAALAASRHYKFDDLSIEVYARVLADVPVEHVERVCRELEKNGEWMPKPAEIRAAAVTLAFRERRARLQAMRDRGDFPTTYCHECADTGWKPTGDRTVRLCDCRPHNPNFLAGRL